MLPYGNDTPKERIMGDVSSGRLDYHDGDGYQPRRDVRTSDGDPCT